MTHGNGQDGPGAEDRDHRIERQRRIMSDWSNSGDVLASILAGLGLGLVADWALGTAPWLVVIGVVAGFAVGFWRMYVRSKEIVDEAQRRQRYDGGEHPDARRGKDDGWSVTGLGGWDD